jgi:Tfp pilus assembly protein PilF
VLIALVAVVSLFDLAAAQSAESWTSFRTKGFSIMGNAAQPELQAAAVKVEQFRWAVSRLYPYLKLDNGKPTQIVIFRDAQAYFEFLPRRPDGSADVGVAGYFQAGEDANYITLAVSHRQLDPLSTAVHEYVHLLIDANFDRTKLPPWLSEGIAEYFETLRLDDKNIVLGDAQPEHLRLLRRSPAIPLDEFFTLNAKDLRTMAPEKRRLYYAQAWAVVHLLMQRHAITIRDFSSGQIFTNTLTDDELAKAIRGENKRSEVVAADETPPPEKFAMSDMPLAAVNATLGDLLLHTGETMRGEALLRKALADDASQALANASLGLLLVRQDKAAEASDLLKRAMTGGLANHLVITGYAFSLLQPLAKTGADISDDLAREIRMLLRRAAVLEPTYTESYRLQAFLNYIRDEDLDGALALLQKALSIKPGDADLQILLARILLRREDIGRARQIAEQVAAASSDAKQKADAADIVKAAYEYTQARSAAAEPSKLNIVFSERPRLVILKRSWLTDADVARIDEERINNNFNRIIIRPVSGEQQIVGRIEKIACAGASIVYRIKSGDTAVNLTSTDFSSVKMTVAREGENTFEIGCGAGLARELAVINYRPALVPAGNKSIGQLTAISFVPENFRLKTSDEMNAARQVAIDDDTIRRSGPSVDVNPETIHRSISQNLRRLQKGEQRLAGTIEKINCTAGRAEFTVLSGDKRFRLLSLPGSHAVTGWFTVASSQISLACGTGPIAASALITFFPGSQTGDVDGELRAIEFVPEGFVP